MNTMLCHITWYLTCDIMYSTWYDVVYDIWQTVWYVTGCMTCYVIHDMWQCVCVCLCLCVCVSVWVCDTCDMIYVIHDLGYDMWHDIWHMTWYLRCNLVYAMWQWVWYMTWCWHVTCCITFGRVYNTCQIFNL